MLHAKFLHHMPFVSGIQDSLFLNIYGHGAFPSWSCDLDFFIQTLLPSSTSIGLAISEDKKSHFGYLHFAYSRFAYDLSHFAYPGFFYPHFVYSRIVYIPGSPTHSICMKDLGRHN